MTKRDTIDTHIYFPPAIFREVKRLAGITRRSISAEIVIAVETHLAVNKPTLLLDAAKRGRNQKKK